MDIEMQAMHDLLNDGKCSVADLHRYLALRNQASEMYRYFNAEPFEIESTERYKLIQMRDKFSIKYETETVGATLPDIASNKKAALAFFRLVSDYNFDPFKILSDVKSILQDTREVTVWAQGGQEYERLIRAMGDVGFLEPVSEVQFKRSALRL